MKSFGMQVNTSAGPLGVPARILEPPNLKYGPGSRQANIVGIIFSFCKHLRTGDSRLAETGQWVRLIVAYSLDQ